MSQEGCMCWGQFLLPSHRSGEESVKICVRERKYFIAWQTGYGGVTGAPALGRERKKCKDVLQPSGNLELHECVGWGPGQNRPQVGASGDSMHACGWMDVPWLLTEPRTLVTQDFCKVVRRLSKSESWTSPCKIPVASGGPRLGVGSAELGRELKVGWVGSSSGAGLVGHTSWCSPIPTEWPWQVF